jgi:hypothetical protein
MENFTHGFTQGLIIFIMVGFINFVIKKLKLFIRYKYYSRKYLFVVLVKSSDLKGHMQLINELIKSGYEIKYEVVFDWSKPYQTILIKK